MKNTNKNSSQTTDRSLKVLMLFADYPELSVSEIAELSGGNISAIYRITNSMMSEGFIEQNDNKKYRLKAAPILRLYNSVSKDIREIARPVVNEVSKSFDEFVYISKVDKVDNADKVIIIEKHDSSHYLKWSQEVGSFYEMPTGTAGKTHLAYLLNEMNDTEKETYLSKIELIPYTDKTITNIQDLLRQTDKVIKNGFCITEGEHIEGVVGISVPVFNIINKKCKFVLTMVMANTRYQKNLKDHYIESLKRAAEQIGERLVE